LQGKHALIIGINRYAFMEEKYQLAGCVNDAELLKSILVNKFGFDPVNIRTLYDEQATRDAIVAEMERVESTIGKDDILVFHYSGHGHTCSVKTEFTDEGSGRANCILPFDDAEPSAEGPVYREIRDHQINDWLARIARKTRYTTLIFDACHSGTMTRSAAGRSTVRSVPSVERPPVARGLTSSDARTGTGAGAGAGGWLNLSDNFVVISGCRDTQTSKETYFTMDGESTKHGVLSYSLTRALLAATPGTTYRDVFEQTCAGVLANASAQNPQIEGRIDREVFGVRDIEPLRFVPVTAVEGAAVTLGGGLAHGLRRGSKWEIYPPGTKQADPGERLGMLLLDEVDGLCARGTLLETGAGQQPVTVGARCIEIEPSTELAKLAVDLSGVPAHLARGLERRLEQSSLLTPAASPGAADVRAAVLDTGESLPDEVSPAVRAQLTQPCWSFFDSGDALIMPLHPVAGPGVEHIVLENLEALARFRNVLALANPQTGLDVAFNLFKRGPDDSLTLANGGCAEVMEGESLVLEIKNNEPERTVFFSIIWLSATREVAHFYPHRKNSEELSPGKTVRIGHDERRLHAVLGDDYVADIGSETCKVIFSTQQADFRWLNQQGMRSADNSSSIAAFDQACTGVASQRAGESADDEKAAPVIDDWCAINRSFILLRKPREPFHEQ
jgi:hypothetical protein